ncbi:MAG: hypothetical protein WC238_00560 [Parcubacteria group bacterium]|jgi:hypothetical protein
MTYQGAEFSTNDLFGEVRETAVREGVSSLTQFRDLIDEIVEEKRIYGFFSDDEDLTQVKENLEARWQEIEKETARK